MMFSPIALTTLALVVMLGSLALLIAGGLVLHFAVRPMLTAVAAAKQADVAGQRLVSVEARLKRVEGALREEDRWAPEYGATDKRTRW
jgi:hypothetical protein